jgi:hypothetical protein
VERVVAYSHGEKEYVALGCGSINLYLHRLDSGEQVGLLPVNEEVKMVYSMAVSIGSHWQSWIDGIDAMRLFIGLEDGVVCVWNMEWARPFARLHIVHKIFQHVRDISPEDEQRK